MKILLAASEMEPFANSGVFGSAILALSTELRARGHEVSVVIPYYRCVSENSPEKPKKTGVKFGIQVGGAKYPADIFEVRAPNGVQVFMVARDEFFDRSGLYGAEDRDYQDNSARFIFFSKSVIEIGRRMDPQLDVLHAHNWQTAMVPVLAHDQRLRMRTVLTAHSLEYQGNFWSYDFGLTNLPGEYFSSRGLEYFGSLNLLKGGILYAESVVLPGPRYVAEAQTPAHGCGLDPVMREQSWKLEGISNGVALTEWSPTRDDQIPHKYDSPAGKTANRDAWAQRHRISMQSSAPALLVETASMESDGMELLLPALDRILEAGACITVLGKVEQPNLAEFLFEARIHRSQLVWLPEYSEADFRQALAASDAMVFAAPVHPAAESLVKALRYGVVPVTLACGGLHALAPDASMFQENGYGFSFFVESCDALADCVWRASRCFSNRTFWNSIATRAMQVDFSWGATAAEYERLYSSLLARSGVPFAA